MSLNNIFEIFGRTKRIFNGDFPSSVQAYNQQLTFRLQGVQEKEKEELNVSFAIVYRAGNLVG